jgi:hypothetical protein
MHVHWRVIRRELLQFLREPQAREQFSSLRAAHPLLRAWPQARLVASFLTRRTPPLDRRTTVARLLLTTTGRRGDQGQVAGAILLLAGAIILGDMGRRGGPMPAGALLLLFREPPLPQRRGAMHALALQPLLTLGGHSSGRAEVCA